MKGVIDIEFFLSVIVFLSTITFVTLVIINSIPLYHGGAYSEDLRAKAYGISQLLLFDLGYPDDWTQESVERLGLSNGTRQVISLTKVSRLNALCSSRQGYDKVGGLLDIDYRNDYMIKIVNRTNATLAACAPPVLSTVRPEFSITRIAVLNNGDIVRLSVGVS